MREQPLSGAATFAASCCVPTPDPAPNTQHELNQHTSARRPLHCAVQCLRTSSAFYVANGVAVGGTVQWPAGEVAGRRALPDS